MITSAEVRRRADMVEAVERGEADLQCRLAGGNGAWQDADGDALCDAGIEYRTVPKPPKPPKPCPFCGTTAVRSLDSRGWYFNHDAECWLSGRAFQADGTMHMRRWNRRAQA